MNSLRKPRHIVFYTPVTLRNGAGAEQWQMTVAPVLQKKFNYTVEIIACDSGLHNLTLAEVQERLGDVTYTELPVQYLLGKIPLPTPAARKLLYQRLQKADAVHYVFGFVGHDVLMKRCLKNRDVQLYAGCHAPILTHSKLHNVYVKTVSRYFTLPFCSGFFVFNPEQAKMLRSWGLKQASTSIAGCVDLQRFKPAKQPPSDTVMELVRVGRAAWDKGTDILCSSLRMWFDRDPAASVHVALIGSGPMEHLVRDLVRDFPNKITFESHSNTVEPYLQKAHVGLVPSREETFGISMIEAMAAGLPVLATDTDGPSRVVLEGKNGWIVKRDSVEAYTQGIERVYALWKKNPSAWRRDWQDQVRSSIMQYSPDVIAERIHNTFASTSKGL